MAIGSYLYPVANNIFVGHAAKLDLERSHTKPQIMPSGHMACIMCIVCV
jgi:hypothetical protein